MSDFGASRKLIGKKDHQCVWCGQIIPKGEEHCHYKGKFDGEWQDWRMHPECFAVHDSADYNGDGSFFPFENERGVKDQA